MSERDDLLRVQDVMRLLNIKRRTVYTIPFLRRTVIHVGPRSPRWRRTDIELHLAQSRGMQGRAA